LWAFGRPDRLCVKFEPAEPILAYGFVGGGIEEVNQHELFRMSGKIIRKRIYETLLALKVGAIETFPEIQPMGPPSRIQARPVSRALRSKGVEPFFVLVNFCFPFFEFVTAHGQRLKNAGREKQEKRDGKCFHDSLPSLFEAYLSKAFAIEGEISVGQSLAPEHAKFDSNGTTWKLLDSGCRHTELGIASVG
jgi:hypothetical protein